QHIVAEILINTAVIFVGSALGFNVDLATGAGPILRGVQRRADAVFGNGIFGDLQARCRLLRLLLYACGVHAIDHVIVVIAAASGKADGALIPAAVVNGARS